MRCLDEGGLAALWARAKAAFAPMEHAAPWTCAYGMGAPMALAASAADVPLAKAMGSGGAAELSSGGLVASRAGTVLLAGSASLGSGFAAGDAVHLRVAVNGAHTGADVVHVMPSASGGTVQIATVASVAAGDVLTLRAWNASGARGTVAASTSTRLAAAFI